MRSVCIDLSLRLLADILAHIYNRLDKALLWNILPGFGTWMLLFGQVVNVGGWK